MKLRLKLCAGTTKISIKHVVKITEVATLLVFKRDQPHFFKIIAKPKKKIYVHFALYFDLNSLRVKVSGQTF